MDKLIVVNKKKNKQKNRRKLFGRFKRYEINNRGKSRLKTIQILNKKIIKGSDRLCKVSFERRICAQTQDLQIFKKFNMSQMNPKEVFHNTAYSYKKKQPNITLFVYQ